MSKEQALSHIESWRATTGKQAFVKMDRETVATQLVDRVNKPFLIQQGQAGLCAPAGFSYELALHHPRAYAQTVTALFDSGEVRIMDLSLKPCTDLKNAPCPINTPQADWILLASIRDSLNWFFDYVTDEYDKAGTNAVKSRMWGGGTYADEVEKLFKKVGYTQVFNEAASGLPAQKALFQRAVSLFNKDFQVLLRINADILDGKDVGEKSHSNHVVVLRDTFIIPGLDAAKVRVPVFTWGEETFIPQKDTMAYGLITRGIFGFVAGKL